MTPGDTRKGTPPPRPKQVCFQDDMSVRKTEVAVCVIKIDFFKTAKNFFTYNIFVSCNPWQLPWDSLKGNHVAAEENISVPLILRNQNFFLWILSLCKFMFWLQTQFANFGMRDSFN